MLCYSVFCVSRQSKLDECNEQLELRKREIGRIQEREKDLTATFQASLGENNKFEDFLTKVFKKKVKHVNKKEQTGEEGKVKQHSVCDVLCPY